MAKAAPESSEGNFKSMSAARVMVAMFRGIQPMARALGHANASTVQGWAERGTIPLKEWRTVCAAASAQSIEGITPDFLLTLHNGLDHL